MKISVDQFLEDPTASQTPMRELARVAENIADVVLEFAVLKLDKEFTVAELESYIAQRKTVAPGSGSRILRKLSADGKITYNLLSRRESRYKMLGVKGGIV